MSPQRVSCCATVQNDAANLNAGYSVRLLIFIEVLKLVLAALQIDAWPNTSEAMPTREVSSGRLFERLMTAECENQKPIPQHSANPIQRPTVEGARGLLLMTMSIWTKQPPRIEGLCPAAGSSQLKRGARHSLKKHRSRTQEPAGTVLRSLERSMISSQLSCGQSSSLGNQLGSA